MTFQDIDSIDHLINSFKDRAKGKGALNIDIRFIFLLEVLRFELITTGKMSDATAGAVNSLFVFQAREFFYRDFPELYNECTSVHDLLIKYNKKYQNYENIPMPGSDDEEWTKYFHHAIGTLVKNNKPTISELWRR